MQGCISAFRPPSSYLGFPAEQPSPWPGHSSPPPPGPQAESRLVPTLTPPYQPWSPDLENGAPSIC